MVLIKGDSKSWIPWGMAGARAALGPVLIAGAACGWSPLALAGMVLTALVSDIFDGVLARRWGTDTAGLRLFDSMADTVFYLCTAVALWVTRPEVLRSNCGLLGAVLGLEVLRLGFDVAKFGKAASYHSYLAKTWGLVMAVAVTAGFATGRANGLIPVALGLGIACNVEGLAMSVMLPVGRRDVKWLGTAWQIRVEQSAKVVPMRRKMLVATLVVAGAFFIAEPSFALSAGETLYAGGTTAGIAKGTVGTLDVADARALTFRSKSSAGASEIEIPYSQITNFQYSTEVTHHIGVLPAIVITLVKKRERRHLFTIGYLDASKAAQVAIFEVPKGEPLELLTILRARASQACLKVNVNFCGGNLNAGSGW